MPGGPRDLPGAGEAREGAGRSPVGFAGCPSLVDRPGKPVRLALLDAIQPPNLARGKSMYVDDGPVDNDPAVRTVAVGILVNLAADPTVRAAMAQDKEVREMLVDVLRQLPIPDPPVPDEDGKVPQGPEGPAPFYLQSRAQLLLTLLALGDACDGAIQRPRLSGEPEEAPAELEVAAQEEPIQDVAEAAAVAGQSIKDVDAAGGGPDAPTDVADLDELKKGSDAGSEQVTWFADKLYLGRLSGDAVTAGVAMVRRRWRDGATEAGEPDNVRISALRALWSFAARVETRDDMIQEPSVHRAFAFAVAEQAVETQRQLQQRQAASQADVAECSLRPQSLEVRAEGICGVLALAGSNDEVRQALWADQRIASGLLDAVARTGRLRSLAVRALAELSLSWANQ
ncbi:unnamed protein product, partial [Polarella glacialis]